MIDFISSIGQNVSFPSYSQVKEFYKSIAVVQRYKEQKAPKEFSHIIANGPNDLHQMDLIEMDVDNGYKYILSIVDVYTRYSGGAAIKNKYKETIAKGIVEVYRTDKYLDFPNAIMTDEGKEFDNKEVKERLANLSLGGFTPIAPVGATDSESKRKRSQPTRFLVNKSTNHRYTGIIERFNRTIERPLFLRQARKELAEAPSSQAEEYEQVITWVKNLKEVLKTYNNTWHRLIHMEPIKAMEHPENVLFYFNGNEKKSTAKAPVLGDTVKLSLPKGKMHRYMEESFTNKRYIVIGIKPSNMVNPEKYIICSEDDFNEGKYNSLPLAFYKEELQIAPKQKVQQIEKRKPITNDENEQEKAPTVSVIPEGFVAKTTSRGRTLKTPARYRGKDTVLF